MTTYERRPHERSAAEAAGPATSVGPRADNRTPLDPAACAELVASDRWAAKVTPGPDGCILWVGRREANGYGRVSLGDRMVKVHRVALVAELGRDLAPGIDAGHLCHDRAHAAGLCDTTVANPCQHRACVNPAHLGEQSRRENTLAGGAITAENAARTHCPRGHELAGDNLRPAKLAQGARGCAACQRDRDRLRTAAAHDAHTALGLTLRDYRALFGSSRAVAERIVEQVAAGRLPALIVAGARAALDAAEQDLGKLAGQLDLLDLEVAS